MPSPDAAPAVGAIVTAFDRIEQTLRTVGRLLACDPPPAQVLVHVDGNQVACADAVTAAFPGVRVLVSAGRVGPGGGRNLLMAAASAPIIASFDDDSYPLDRDYFARVRDLFARFPEAAVVAGRVFHVGEAVSPGTMAAAWGADFSGGAASYRRDRFVDAGGYVPLVTAYGMEEVDLALRMHAKGDRVLQSQWLRVFHDTDLARHADPAVTAASIANIALLAFLRYPVALWFVGLAQLGNRIQWLLRHGRRHGVLAGIWSTPGYLLAHRSRRQPLPIAAVRSYLALRRRPVPVSP